MWIRETCRAIAFGGTLCLITACTNDNMLGNVTDMDSPQARLEAAQIALDNGDCQAAVDGFGPLLSEYPGDLQLTMGLSAALVCRAGFDVVPLVGVAAEFAAGGATVTNANVFKAVLDNAVTGLNPAWQTDLNAAEALLAPYSSTDPDVAFNLGVINMIEATLIISDALDYLNGAPLCTGNPCIDNTIAQNIITALADSLNSLAAAGLVSDSLTDTVNTIQSDINAINGNPLDTVTGADINQYLECQGIDVPNFSPAPCP